MVIGGVRGDWHQPHLSDFRSELEHHAIRAQLSVAARHGRPAGRGPDLDYHLPALVVAPQGQRSCIWFAINPAITGDLGVDGAGAGDIGVRLIGAISVEKHRILVQRQSREGSAKRLESWPHDFRAAA